MGPIRRKWKIGSEFCVSVRRQLNESSIEYGEQHLYASESWIFGEPKRGKAQAERRKEV